MEEDLLLYCQCNAMPVGSMPRVRVARHANANAKAPDCGSKSGDVGRSLRAADGVQRCFVRPGEERRTALGLFALFFGAQGLRRCRQGEHGTVMRVGGRREERQGREREACWLVG